MGEVGCVSNMTDDERSDTDTDSYQILHISNLLTMAFNLGCAFSPNTGSLLALRFVGRSSLQCTGKS